LPRAFNRLSHQPLTTREGKKEKKGGRRESKSPLEVTGTKIIPRQTQQEKKGKGRKGGKNTTSKTRNPLGMHLLLEGTQFL